MLIVESLCLGHRLFSDTLFQPEIKRFPSCEEAGHINALNFCMELGYVVTHAH